METDYGADRMAIAQHDRQSRQLADDFETDLKVVKELDGISSETGPDWLTE